MSITLPSILHSCRRSATRVVIGLALVLGILAAAPMTDAHAGTHHRLSHRAVVAHKVRHGMRIALHQKGDPYRYGAAGPRRFDCSGLTYYSFRHAGFVHMPRTSSAQARFAKRIPKRHIHRGDLMFFYDGGGVYHVGVFAGARHGHRRVLHAPHSGTRVQVDRVWTHRWFAGTLRNR